MIFVHTYMNIQQKSKQKMLVNSKNKMININSPKVSTPAALFALLSPGLIFELPDTFKINTMKTSRQSVIFHALVFVLVYSMVAKSMGLVLRQTDLIVPGVLFILLSPGMFLTIPQGSNGMFMSGQTSMVSILTHTLVFAIIFALLRKTFPQYY